VQGYNAQIAVDGEAQVIVAALRQRAAALCPGDRREAVGFR